jgi:Leucine-rich repeat (LRR) protein
MKTAILKLAGAIVPLAICLAGFKPADVRGDEPPQARKVAPPKSLILELETNNWGSEGWGNARTITEVRATPGDRLGDTAGRGSAAATVVEIIDKDHVKVRIADDLVISDSAGRERTDKEAIVVSGEKLTFGTPSYDGGTGYTLKMSDLDQVPVVKADDPDVIAAIAAHANVTKDDAGSIQEVGPRGIVAPGGYGYGGTGFDPAKLPNDEDMEKIGKLNNLRRLFLPGSAITDAGAVHLKNLTRLRELDLSRTKIGDATLPYIAGLKRLEELNLSGTDISDKGIKLLQSMTFPKLKTLPGRAMPPVVHLEYSKITREGFWQLLLAPPPWYRVSETDGYLWGRLDVRGKTVWPKQLAGAKTEREKTLFRLLLLGCSLKTDAEGSVVEAHLELTAPTTRYLCYRTTEQTREVFDLLAKLGSVSQLTIRGSWGKQTAPLDDAEAALIANLRQLKTLNLAGCWLTDAAWLRLAGLAQLRNLNLEYAKISGEAVRKLHKALPNCKITGRPTTDEKTPVASEPPDAVLGKVRQQFPGKGDEQIVKVLRSYVRTGGTGNGRGKDWFVHRLQAAKKQWRAVRAIEGAGGRVLYDFSFDASGTMIQGAKPSSPADLRELLGDDFFNDVLIVDTNVASERFRPAEVPKFEGVEHLPDLPHLRAVTINSDEATDDELGYLKDLRELWMLTYQNSGIRGTGMTHLGALTQLQALHLWCTQSGDGGMAQLKDLTNLEELDLGLSDISDAGLENLKGLRKLRSLYVWSEHVTDAGLEHFKGLTNMRSLRLVNAEVTDAGMKCLEGLTKLISLELPRSKVTDAGLEHLAGLKQLEKLSLLGTSITDAGLAHLMAFRKLKNLDVSQTRVTGGGLEQLRQLPRLETLSVSVDQVEGGTLIHLSSLKHLKTLFVHNPQRKAVGDLQKELPGCKVLVFPIVR